MVLLFGRRPLSQRDIVLIAVFIGFLCLFLFNQLLGNVWEQSDSPLHLSAETVIFEKNSGSYISIQPKYELKESAKLKLVFSDGHMVETMESIIIPPYSIRALFIPLHARGHVGHCTLTFKSKSTELEKLYKAHVHIKIVENIYLGYLSIVMGWSYFFVWSIAYYPQVYQNWRRRSVVGLSFDYQLLNIIGHSCYCVFNTCMYWNSYIQKEYLRLNPKSEIPVQANDNFFSIHAVILTAVIITQCLIYDRGDQRLTLPFILLALGSLLVISSGLASALVQYITWIQYIYMLSYVKVAVTPLKYFPQALLNYGRQSTEGFAIKGVMLDFSGSILSLLQSVLESTNHNDWKLLLGNPGKLALSFIGMFFNVVFFCQHMLYNKGTTRCRKESGSPKKWKNGAAAKSRPHSKMLKIPRVVIL